MTAIEQARDRMKRNSALMFTLSIRHQLAQRKLEDLDSISDGQGRELTPAEEAAYNRAEVRLEQVRRALVQVWGAGQL